MNLCNDCYFYFKEIVEPFCSIHYCIAENMKRISPEQETCDKFKLFKKGGEGE